MRALTMNLLISCSLASQFLGASTGSFAERAPTKIEVQNDALPISFAITNLDPTQYPHCEQPLLTFQNKVRSQMAEQQKHNLYAAITQIGASTAFSFASLFNPRKKDKED